MLYIYIYLNIDKFWVLVRFSARQRNYLETGVGRRHNSLPRQTTKGSAAWSCTVSRSAAKRLQRKQSCRQISERQRRRAAG